MFSKLCFLFLCLVWFYYCKCNYYFMKQLILKFMSLFIWFKLIGLQITLDDTCFTITPHHYWYKFYHVSTHHYCKKKKKSNFEFFLKHTSYLLNNFFLFLYFMSGYIKNTHFGRHFMSLESFSKNPI